MDRTNAEILVNEQDLRFLEWLAFRCSPFGAEAVGKSATTERLERWGLVARFGGTVTMTGLGWKALLRAGFEPQTGAGESLEEVERRVLAERRAATLLRSPKRAR